MPITTDDETRRTNDAVVSVRIPDGADGDLTTEAERRLSRAEGVADATVTGLRDLDPGLSATVVTVAVAVEPTGEPKGFAATDLLADAPFVEAVADG